jgi:hypothetical protein
LLETSAKRTRRLNLARRRYQFFPAQYEQSVADYAQRWQKLDEYLYRLCRENPTHSCYGFMNAKIFMIGLTYETGIKRGVPTKKTQSSSISQVTDLFLKHQKELDLLFTRLYQISEPLTASNLPEILEIHGRMVEILRVLTRNGRSSRSFVSKYMHFHNAVVPPYDSFAAAVISSLVPKSSIDVEGTAIPKKGDKVYADYARRFLMLYESLKQMNLTVTVRSLDYYLVWKHDHP